MHSDSIVKDEGERSGVTNELRNENETGARLFQSQLLTTSQPSSRLQPMNGSQQDLIRPPDKIGTVSRKAGQSTA